MASKVEPMAVCSGKAIPWYRVRQMKAEMALLRAMVRLSVPHPDTARISGKARSDRSAPATVGCVHQPGF